MRNFGLTAIGDHSTPPLAPGSIRAPALRRQHPHVLLRDHRVGEADQLAGVALVDVDVPGLAAVDHDVDHLAVLVLRLGQDRRADGVQVPHVVGDVLEVPLVRAVVQVDRDDRVGVEVVAGADVTVQVGRGIADHEEDRARLLVHRRSHPHAAAQRLVERAAFANAAFSSAMSRCMSRPVASFIAQTPSWPFSGIV